MLHGMRNVTGSGLHLQNDMCNVTGSGSHLQNGMCNITGNDSHLQNGMCNVTGSDLLIPCRAIPGIQVVIPPGSLSPNIAASNYNFPATPSANDINAWLWLRDTLKIFPKIFLKEQSNRFVPCRNQHCLWHDGATEWQSDFDSSYGFGNAEYFIYTQVYVVGF